MVYTHLDSGHLMVSSSPGCAGPVRPVSGHPVLALNPDPRLPYPILPHPRPAVHYSRTLPARGDNGRGVDARTGVKCPARASLSGTLVYQPHANTTTECSPWTDLSQPIRSMKVITVTLPIRTLSSISYCAILRHIDCPANTLCH